MTYLRAVGLAHGHPPERIDEMPIADLELLAVYDLATNRPLLEGL